MGERTLNFGTDATDADYQIRDSSSTGGNLVIEHLPTGATFEYDATENAWVPTDPIGTSNRPVPGIFSDSVDTEELNNARYIPPSVNDLGAAINSILNETGLRAVQILLHPAATYDLATQVDLSPSVISQAISDEFRLIGGGGGYAHGSPGLGSDRGTVIVVDSGLSGAAFVCNETRYNVTLEGIGINNLATGQWAIDFTAVRRNSKLEGITVDASNQDAKGITLTDCYPINIENVNLSNLTDPFEMDNCNGSNVEDLMAKENVEGGANDYAITILSSNGVSADSVMSEGNEQGGIELNECRAGDWHIFVEGNNIAGNVSQDILVQATSGADMSTTIKGKHTSTNSARAVYLDAARVTFQGFISTDDSNIVAGSRMDECTFINVHAGDLETAGAAAPSTYIGCNFTGTVNKQSGNHTVP